MTESISPAQLQDLLAGYVLYDLSPEESVTLTELLATNPDLQRDIDQLQQTLELAYDGEPISPPEFLKNTLMQGAIASAAPARPSAAPATPASGPAPRWGRLWGAAAAVLIAGLSLSNLMLWRSLQRASRLGDDTLTIALGSADDPAPGQAQVVINPDTLVGSLTVENLPPLEPGSVYVLWTVVDPNAAETLDDKDAILTTIFTVDDQGRLSQPIDLPPVYRRDRSLIRAVAITKESAAAPQEHLSAPILIQPL